MAIVPTHKGDIETCRALGSASDEEVCGHLGELLIWLQDMNWPVAPLIVRRLKTLGAPLVEPIREILIGTDDIWKYWIVSVLLPGVDASVRDSLMCDLQRIISAPTSGEVNEEVVDVTKRLLRETGE
jgi:hypothetical protein